MVDALAAVYLPAAPALAAGGGDLDPDAVLIEIGRGYLDLVKLSDG
jgi:hypothetical protein